MSSAATASAAVLRPLPLPQVKLTDTFWAPRQATNAAVTLNAAYEQCRDTGRLDAFRLTWKQGDPNPPHIFWDSDVAKWVEAASYALATQPTAALRAQVDEVVALIAGAQGPDGYLNTHYQTVEPDKRWSNLRDHHELYCAGHLIEAAVAHYQATGTRTLLDVLCRYADYIATVFGPNPGQKRGYCGHEEIELALVKLHRATGEPRYLALAKYFVDERGAQPHYYDAEARARGDDPAKYWAKTYSYCQAHLPVREMREVTGHSVRAMYLYSAMADLAAECADAGLRSACEHLWQHLTSQQLYITGGIGASHRNEGFLGPYDLPNETAYCETCAAVGLVFWMQRLANLTGDGRYADTMETALYNGALSGISLSGDRFFYANPLALYRRDVGKHPDLVNPPDRVAWFGCACCPPNIARLIASVGGYLYGVSSDTVAVHLYAHSDTQLTVAGTPLRLRQVTNYPWDGTITLQVDPAQPTHFTLRLRQPGWCPQANLLLNGAPVAAVAHTGYLTLSRQWQAGDTVTLTLAMDARRVYAHPQMRANHGRVALARGPLVYCVESADTSADLVRLALPRRAPLSAVPCTAFGQHVLAVSAPAQVVQQAPDAPLYSGTPPAYEPATLVAIPYAFWGNRAPGDMTVWLQES